MWCTRLGAVTSPAWELTSSNISPQKRGLLFYSLCARVKYSINTTVDRHFACLRTATAFSICKYWKTRLARTSKYMRFNMGHLYLTIIIITVGQKREAPMRVSGHFKMRSTRRFWWGSALKWMCKLNEYSSPHSASKENDWCFNWARTWQFPVQWSQGEFLIQKIRKKGFWRNIGKISI